MSLAALAAAVRPALARMIGQEARSLPTIAGMGRPFSTIVARVASEAASTRGLAASALTPSTSYGHCAMQIRGMAHNPTPKYKGGKLRPASYVMLLCVCGGGDGYNVYMLDRKWRAALLAGQQAQLWLGWAPKDV